MTEREEILKMRATRGRHRLGTPGLVWCREHAAVAAALTRPDRGGRGFFERLFSRPRPAYGLG